MATVLIHAGAASGAMGAILFGRAQSGILAASYSGDELIAKAIADEVAAKAASVTLADADLATPNMEILCSQVTQAILSGRDLVSTASSPPVAADYATVALQICAAVKGAIAAI